MSHNKFGFDVYQSRTIDYAKINTDLLQFIVENEPSFASCISCGACTATCSAANLTYFNIRRLSIQIRLGEINNVITEIDKCMLCGKCLLVCPRGINTRNVIMVIKKALVRN